MESLASIDCFVRSAEAGSFSAAARALGITPAAVSKSVAKLEQGLGVRLFQRTTRSLTLTEPGERFLGEVRNGLSVLSAAIAGASSTRTEAAGTLRVSLPPIGRDFVMPMLAGFLARYPAIVPDWDFRNRQVDLVAEGFDAAIGASLDLAPGIVARELARVHVVAVASPGYLARHPAPKSPKDLAHHDGVLLRSAQTGRIRSWPFRNAAGDEASVSLRTRVVVNDAEAACQGAQLGLGIALVPMPVAIAHLERGALVRVLPTWHADAGRMCVYFANPKLMPQKTRVFVDYVVSHFREHRLAERFRSPTRG